MKRAFVTGHSGFTGRHLMNHLRSTGYYVSGIGRSSGGDIRDASHIGAALRSFRPDVVFHLAGATKTTEIDDLYSTNVIGTATLLETISQLDVPPVVVIASSSAVYGFGANSRPISEAVRPHPVTQYGASKLAMEVVAQRYARAHQLRIVCSRAFNLIGPGLPNTLACGAFVEAIVRIEQSGSKDPIRTGNLGSLRDFTDVRDVVRAYVLLAERGRAGTSYNVCSGRGVSLEYCLQILLREARAPIQVEFDSARMQSQDIPSQVGDSSRIRALTGWEPSITVEQSLLDTLEHRRREAGR
jgi:GDP-4-dehydro-6-deoxy-D-mannose reductase